MIFDAGFGRVHASAAYVARSCVGLGLANAFELGMSNGIVTMASVTLLSFWCRCCFQCVALLSEAIKHVVGDCVFAWIFVGA